MDSNIKTRNVVQKYSYEKCAPLFDAFKEEQDFFASEEEFKVLIEKESGHKCPEMSWRPWLIEGKHWVPALMNTMWRFYQQVYPHREFYEAAGIDADEGVLNSVIKECFKLSGYDKSEEYQRICTEESETRLLPWNAWLSMSLRLRDQNNAESGLNFRYFCGWLIALLSRTVKSLIHHQSIVRKDEVHVIALTAEDIFIRRLAEKGRQGSLKDAVLEDLPSDFLNLGQGDRKNRRKRAHFQDVDEDDEEMFVPTDELLVGESTLQYLKSLMDSSTKSSTAKKREAERIIAQFKSDLDMEVKRLAEMNSMMTEVQCIYDKECEKFRRSRLYQDGTDELLKSIEKLGVPKPSKEEILQLKTTFDQYLLENHGSRPPSSIPVVSLKKTE